MGFEFSSESLPTSFNFKEASERIFNGWVQAGYFHGDPESEKPHFSIVIPPPNVTGALHLGHALNNTLQDILARMKRMQGFETLWMPGTDHAGIATQAVVERRLKEEENKTRHDLGREALVERIWDWKGQYEKRIISQLKQLGSSCDWERTRFTLDEICARAVRTTFFDLFRKKYIYRGKRLVNWDTFLQTAVSDDEVFHAVVDGHFWHFRYPVVDPQAGEPTGVTVATTRPETMLGDTAVAVHPDPEHALEKVQAELELKLQNASDDEKEQVQQQLDAFEQRKQIVLPDLIKLRDMALAGRKLRLPLMNREIPLVADQWAKPEMGSGCVKITPAHDPNDYEVGQRCGLEKINILRSDGTLNANAGDYQGLTIQQARKRVVEDLENLGLIQQIEDREIDLAHSDRSKTPIEPYLADQWFVRMQQLAQSAMDAVTDERVQIFPKRYRKGYLDWLGEKRDWPVSRQLWWGHQIPIWSYACRDQADLDARLVEIEGETEIQSGTVAYQVELTAELNEQSRVVGDDASDTFAVIHVCINEENESLQNRFVSQGFVREEDVLDTWFSSALWPHSTLGWPEQTAELAKFYPTSTLITSRDIITLWVARMVLMGLNNMGQVPFGEVFIHPKILDGYGETMSKSKGNGVDPLDVIEKFGPDALRFGLAYLTTETQDVRMPVQFECPHCQSLLDQTKKNRELPRVVCKNCGEEFKTQWARKEEDLVLPSGPVVSERFEVARNFCTKLWNASRFTLLNLSGYEAAPVQQQQLAFEDRWLLSRLSSVTGEVTKKLEHYGYADAARAIYDFAWDDFCSFYIEMTKSRMQDEEARPVAQRVTAFALDQLLRLLHPMIPFVTEEVWGLLSQIAPQRGLTQLADATDSIMLASWPEVDEQRIDPLIEQQFSLFQDVLRAIREIRSRQNIAPKQEVEFSVACSDEIVELLRPMDGYFQSMANARSVVWGQSVDPPANSANVRIEAIEVFVDLKNFIDVDAEIERNKKLLEKLQGQVQGKQKKLANENFVARAPADVVQRERDGLVKLEEEIRSVEKALAALESQN
ncbi:MAG: valine--tRNA ligase [Planctomycetaceae bacterium]|nr:valine--tRNA ligase [Planctomycetaceae bacterium]|tara:strand:+ start:8089 stop:11235 length:3147 start_codon:yes stop_codon:yes gene_type:complete